MILVMVMLAMLYIIPVIAFIVLMIWLLHRVNRPGKVWVGWVMILGVFILVTSGCFLGAKYGVTTGDGWHSYQIWLEDQGIQYAGINVAYDRKTKEVYGFGSLVLQDENGNRYIPLEFDQEGNLIGTEEALVYKNEIQDVLITGGPKVMLTGKSRTFEALNQLKHEMMNQHSNTFQKDIFYYNMIWFNSITAILVAYYLLDLRRRKNKEKRNTNPIKIQDL